MVKKLWRYTPTNKYQERPPRDSLTQQPIANWEQVEVDDNFVPPAPEPIPQPNYVDFFNAIRSDFTRPIINVIAPLDIALSLDIRAAFDSQNIPQAVQFWDEAVGQFPIEIATIMNGNINGQTRADFVTGKAIIFNVPLRFNPDLTLSSAIG